MKAIPLLFGWSIVPPRICCNSQRIMTCDRWGTFMSWLKKKHSDTYQAVGWAIIEWIKGGEL